MSDDKTKKGTQDRERINLNQRYEVQYWTKKFGISEEELRAAVERAGPNAEAVELYLKRKAS
jgi:hypothetical protein